LECQYRDALYGIGTPRFKLIRGPGDRLKLFDLHVDPGERKNLARSHPGVAGGFEAELEAWRRTRPGLSGDGSKTKIDPSTGDRLRALGYLD
jgi:hypothetical protein